MSPSVSAALDRLDNIREEALARLFYLLRVFNDPDFKPESRNTAPQWCVDRLQTIGFDSGLRGTAGNRMAVAHHGPRDPENCRRVLALRPAKAVPV